MNDPIRQFQSELKELSAKAERLRPIVKACYDAITRAESNTSISVCMRDSHPTIIMCLLCKSLKETIPLFRELAKEGLHTDKNHKDDTMLDIIPYRQYTLGSELMLIAMVNSKKEEDGPSCRLEQVGIKETPVYEMKCDD